MSTRNLPLPEHRLVYEGIMDLFNSFSQVTSWLTLAAFAIAVVGALVSRYLSRDARLIAKAPSDRRAELIEKFLGRQGIDASNLTKEQRFKLLHETIRQRRLPWIVITLAGAFLTIVLLVAIVSHAADSGSPPREEKSFISPAGRDETLVLVAIFDGPEPNRYRITDLLVSSLRDSLSDVQIRVEALPVSINISNGGRSLARSEGERLNAAIVIWGWYGVTSVAVPVSANFEVIKHPYALISPGLCPSARGKPRTFSASDLQSLKVQLTLASEFQYLSLIATALARYSAEDCEQAIDLLGKALSSAENEFSRNFDEVALAARGDCYRKQGKIFFAIADYAKSITIYPSASVYEKMGDTYSQTENSAQEIASFLKAIHLEPDKPELFVKLGIAYEKKADNRAALAAYRKAIELDDNQAFQAGPALYLFYLQRGGARTRQMVIGAVNHRLETEPGHPFARFMRASLADDKAIAVADIRYLANKFPRSATLHFELAGTMREAQKYKAALEEYERAIKLNGRHACSYINRGAVYFRLGDTKSALESYEKAVEVDPKSSTALAGRAILYANQGRQDEALRDMTKAISVEPNSAVLFAQRGGLHLRRGRIWAAHKDLAFALRLDPDNAYARSKRETLVKVSLAIALVAACAVVIGLNAVRVRLAGQREEFSAADSSSE